jgi:hypothetical protein
LVALKRAVFLISEAIHLYFFFGFGAAYYCFFCDFTAFFAADFLAAGVFADEDILSKKKFESSCRTNKVAGSMGRVLCFQ